MADLLYILFGFSCFVYVELATTLLVWSNLSQSYRRSAYGEFSPTQLSGFNWGHQCLWTFTWVPANLRPFNQNTHSKGTDHSLAGLNLTGMDYTKQKILCVFM